MKEFKPTASGPTFTLVSIKVKVQNGLRIVIHP